MKKIKFLIVLNLIIIIIVCLTSCSNEGGIFVYNYATEDATEYDAIKWNKIRKPYGKKSDLFPSSIENLNIVSYKYSYNRSLLWGISGQVYVCIKYDNDAFHVEEHRISEIRDISKIRYDETEFNFPAYVAIESFNSISEYALIDKDNLSIHYVFIRGIDDSNVVLDSEILPKHWNERLKNNLSSFSVYDAVRYNIEIKNGKDTEINTNPQFYNEIEWNQYDGALSENYGSIFPRNINVAQCRSFYSRKDPDLFFEWQFQVYLCMKYDENDFDKEIKRLSELCPEKYDQPEFIMTSYVAQEAYFGQYEYALIDEQNQIIHYIFMFAVDQNHLSIEKQYLPMHWCTGCASNASSFTIYAE